MPTSSNTHGNRSQHVDVMIVGAGISGVNAAYRLQTRSPESTYAILEAREAIGGTWDLFRYPGIRSDGDLFQFSFPFAPWTSEKSIADGGTIRDYIRDTAHRFGIDKRIRFGSKLLTASWSSEDSTWTLDVQQSDGTETSYTCNFLYMCSGYYSYESGYLPEFVGVDSFAGEVVHPQRWPENLDYSGKKVVVIGSGATAITLVPAMAKEAEKVTLLQRTPGYMVAIKDTDSIANLMRRFLPKQVAHTLARWKNVFSEMFFFHLFRGAPNTMKKKLIEGVAKKLPADFKIDPHFVPPYNPMDQRMLLALNGDLFEALSSGKADMVTDHIDTFTPTGIRLKSGDELEADVIVTATGLRLAFAGEIQVMIDGEKINLADRVAYKAIMLDGVPNFAFCFGYSNAPWTLRADLAAKYVSRLVKHMHTNGYVQAVPRLDDDITARKPLMALQSGYVQRAGDILPQQGAKGPWFLRQNYVVDVIATRFGPIDDAMEYSTKPQNVSHPNEA